MMTEGNGLRSFLSRRQRGSQTPRGLRHPRVSPGRPGGYPPGLPQIRACPIKAHGSSCYVRYGTAYGVPRLVPVALESPASGRESHLRTLSSESCYPSLFRGHVHGFRCTRHVSLQRSRNKAPPSLHRVPRNGSPGSSVLRDAPTPVRPSRRTSLPSFGDTTLASCLLPAARTRGRGLRGVGMPVLRAGMSVETDRVSQVPEQPLVSLRPVLRTPVGPNTPGHCGVSTRPPHVSTTKAPDEEYFGAQSARHWTRCLSLKVKGGFSTFFGGCWRPHWTTRSLTLWILSVGLIRCPLEPAHLWGSCVSQGRSGTEPIG